MGQFFGASTHGIHTHSGFRKCIWKVGTTNFWPCFGRPKLGECDKMGSVSKIMSRPKKFIRPQFSKYRFQIESAWAHRLWAHADSIWKWYFENCGRICFSTLHLHFFWKKGKLRLPLTQPKTPSTPLCHTYSEPPGHEDSPGGIQIVPYLYKKLITLPLSNPFFGNFLSFLSSRAEVT